MDVGKGDCILIEPPGGGAFLVDSASEGMGTSVIAPFLRARGIRQIDTLVLTHPHPDHVGGAPRLIKEFNPRVVIDNGYRPDHPLVRRYRTEAESRGIPVREIRRGSRVTLPGQVMAAAIAPGPATPKSTNDSSIVLKIVYGRRAFLLAGDAQYDSEREMIESGAILAADVLKVAHHGSGRATSYEFLERVRPEFAVISVDSNNPLGYPARETLDRLDWWDARILRTDRYGHVTFRTNGTDLRYDTAHPESMGILPK